MLEKIKPYINYILLALGAILFVLFCRGGLYSDRSGIDEIGNQLQRIGEYNNEQRTRVEQSQRELNELEARIGDLQNAISESAAGVDRVAENERNARRIIKDSQSILEGVRKRGKTQAKQIAQ